MFKKVVILALILCILFGATQMVAACNPTPRPCTPKTNCKSTPTPTQAQRATPTPKASPQLISITVVPSKMTLKELRTKGHPIVIIARYSNGGASIITENAEFSSSNSNIAYVVKGNHLYTVCSGDTPGQATITVTYQGKSDTCIVTVGKNSCPTPNPTVIPTPTSPSPTEPQPSPTQAPTASPIPTPTLEATPTPTPLMVNHTPVLNPIGAQTVAEGALLQFNVTANDPDGDPLTYRADGLPAGATFDENAGVFQWSPGFDQAEQPSPVVRFEVSDDQGGQVSEVVTITVTDVNRLPIFDPIGNKVADEGELLQFTATANDPDSDTLSYSATGLPHGATFDPLTGLFRWVPDYYQSGKPSPLVTFKVTDGRSQEIIQFVTINVNNVDPEELIPNPNFDTGIDSWHCICLDNTAAEASANWDTTDYGAVSNGVPGSLQVKCTNKGAAYNEIQLFTNYLNLVQDQSYLLTFKAKASTCFSIHSIKLNQAAIPWTDYSLPYRGLTITTNWQSYAVIFTANTTTADGRLTFFLGNGIPDGATFNIDTVSLKKIVVYAPSADELLPNPDFDYGVANWTCSNDSTAQAFGYLDAADHDTPPVSYKIECVSNGDTLNSIQLFSMPFAIEQNKTYQFTFKAKCDASFAIPSIRLMQAGSPWTNYATSYSGLTIAASSGPSGWQTYTIIFTAKTTAADGRITFFLGNALPEGATFYVDTLSLREATP